MAKSYTYKARDLSGKIQLGMLVSDDEAGVATILRNKGWLVSEIREQKEKQGLTFSFSKPKVGVKDLSIWTRQFATMIQAGLPLMNTLTILEQQTVNLKLKKATFESCKAVQNGESLSRALSLHPDVFPTLLVSMVEAGEIGGMLEQVVARLANYFEKEHKLNAKVKGAMMYPVVVMCVAALVLAFILIVIVPQFTQMFKDMSLELPLPTQIMVAFSDFLKSYWWLVLGTIGAAIFAFNKYTSTPLGKQQWDTIKLKLPIFGELSRKVAISRFSSTLGALLRGGVGIIQALDVVKRVADNHVIMKAVASAQSSIREGQGLTTPIRESKVFDPMAVQMIAIGEETGQLDNMMEKVAEILENEVDEMVGGMSKLIEPLMIVFLGISVGGIVISIFLPMFDIMKGVQ